MFSDFSGFFISDVFPGARVQDRQVLQVIVAVAYEVVEARDPRKRFQILDRARGSHPDERADRCGGGGLELAVFRFGRYSERF